MLITVFLIAYLAGHNTESKGFNLSTQEQASSVFSFFNYSQ